MGGEGGGHSGGRPDQEGYHKGQKVRKKGGRRKKERERGGEAVGPETCRAASEKERHMRKGRGKYGQKSTRHLSCCLHDIGSNPGPMDVVAQSPIVPRSTLSTGDVT